MKKPIRVLVVDDSMICREVITTFSHVPAGLRPARYPQAAFKAAREILSKL